MITKFENIEQDTPRLVVMFKREGDKEMFQWGMVGALPILTTIGCIVRVQAELSVKESYEHKGHNTPESALVIAWDGEENEFEWFVHPDIPVDSLVGMLETIKVTLTGSYMARQAAAQQLLLGPDGRPMRR